MHVEEILLLLDIMIEQEGRRIQGDIMIEREKDI